MNPLESFSIECDASGIERRVESSASTSTKDGWMTYEYAPIQRGVMNVETKSVTVKCGNLEIKPPSEGRIWGSIWLDGVEMPFVTSVKLTWEVPDIWRCEIGHIVDPRVTGKPREAKPEDKETWRDREPMLLVSCKAVCRQCALEQIPLTLNEGSRRQRKLSKICLLPRSRHGKNESANGRRGSTRKRLRSKWRLISQRKARCWDCRLYVAMRKTMPTAPKQFRLGPSKEQAAKYRDQRRGSARQRGYDARWERFRRWYAGQHPAICVRCLERGVIEPATDLDHIRPIQSTDDPGRLDENNVQWLCRSHHKLKTNADKAAGLTRGASS